MKKTFFIALCFMALPMSAMSQLIQLSSSESKNKLWLDPDHIYNYNLYEKSRWGLGLQYDINFKTEKELAQIEKPCGFKTLSLSAYGAYGYGDLRFKWGLKADLQGASKRQSHTYMSFFHDLTADASRTLATPTLAILTTPGSLMTRLFSDTYRLTVGRSQKINKWLSASLELRLSRERPLYWAAGSPDLWALAYPSSYNDLKILTYNDFIEGQLYLIQRWGWSAKLLGGCSRQEGGNVQGHLNLLTQYDRSFKLSFLKLGIYAQGGITTPNAPYSRMFDFGGTWSSPILLNHSLLTARISEFTVNFFGMASLKLTTQKSLIELYNNILEIGTAPYPFLLANAAWGNTWEKNDYIAPDHGIAEVGAGIDGILVWGQVFWGAAVVYRLTPASAAYHFSDPKDNLSFLFTAYLNL